MEIHGWLIGIGVAVLVTGPLVSDAAARQRAIRVTLVDKVNVAATELARAKAAVEEIFRAVDVGVEWLSDHRIGSAVTDGAKRGPVFTLMLVSNHDPVTTTGGCILGRAVPALSSGYVFFNRIVETSALHPIDVAAVLGRVMTHELGHLLLSGGHAPYGIMRADLDLGFRNPDRFTPDQARQIRARVLDAIAQR